MRAIKYNSWKAEVAINSRKYAIENTALNLAPGAFKSSLSFNVSVQVAAKAWLTAVVVVTIRNVKKIT
jgi:hypothetical protein